MKKRMFFLVAASLSFLLSAVEPYPVSLELNQWNYRFFNHPTKNETLSNLGNNGEKQLRLTCMNVPGVEAKQASAYTRFEPPVDGVVQTHFRFRLRFSKPIEKGAFVSIYYQGWAEEGVKKIQDTGLNELKGNTILPANEWISFEIPLHLKMPINIISFNFMTDKLGKDETLTVDFADIEFFAPTVDFSIAAKRAEWDSFLKNFKPDYSDGAYLMNPPDGNRFPSPLPIVRDGKPMAELSFNQAYNAPCVETAVKDFQAHVKLMTGVELPINSSLNNPDATKIVVGRNEKMLRIGTDAFAEELRELHGTDGFTVRREGNTLYVFGQTDKGSMNGLYALLENNTDLIWARPDKTYGTVCSRNLSDLKFVWGENVLEKPASPIRGYMTYTGLEWMARNRCNSMTGGGGDNYWSFANAKPWGADEFFARGGHNIGEFVAAKDPKGDNPLYYGLVGGVRKRGNHVCFSNPEMRKYFIANFLHSFRCMPSDIAGANLWLDDTYDWCECPGCNAPLKMADGTIVERTDPAYTSTVAFQFFNEIAEAYVKEFPGKKIRVGAYWQTAEVPKCEVHPALIPMFCPYVRVNDKNPIYSPENMEWLEKLARWKKKVPRVDIYGYNQLGLNFPRPLCHTHSRDFQEFYQYSTGIQAEANETFGDGAVKTENINPWDYSAIELWVMTQLSWNPSRNVEKLYKKFCYRAFREAAKPMEKFYGILRGEFLHSPLSTTIGEYGTNATNDYIIRPGHEEEMRACLDEAAKLAVHPSSRWMIERIRERFEFYISKIRAQKTPSLSVPMIRSPGDAAFDSPVWKNAAIIENFVLMKDGKTPAENKTAVSIFHDSENLWLRFECTEKDPSGMRLTKAEAGTEFMGGNHFEIFLEDAKQPGTYYIFGVCPDGNAADYRLYDIAWKSPWMHSVSASPDGSVWKSVVKIPLSVLSCRLSETNVLKGTFLREAFGKGSEEYSSWSGGRHHQTTTFGTITLMR